MEREIASKDGFRIERDLNFYPDGHRYTVTDGFALLIMDEPSIKSLAKLLVEALPFTEEELKDLGETVLEGLGA